jgi:coatomer subunit beta
MPASEASCYTIIFEDSSESPSTQELRAGLEKGSDEVKFDTLRKIIISTINGNHQVRALCRFHARLFVHVFFLFGQPQLLMPIIQYVLPSKHKALKKLLHFYWEVCPKYDENGKLKQEMILVVCVFFSLMQP